MNGVLGVDTGVLSAVKGVLGLENRVPVAEYTDARLFQVTSFLTGKTKLI